MVGKSLADLAAPDDTGFSVAYSLDGTAVALGGSKGTILYINMERNKSRRWDIDAAGCVAVGLSGSGRQLVAACQTKGLRLLDPDTGAPLRVFEGRPGQIWQVAVSPEGRYALTAGDDKIVRLWDITNGSECHRFEAHTAPVRQVVFTPDGKHALSASADGSLRLWDLPVRVDFAGVRRWKPKPGSPANLAPEPPPPPVASTDKPIRRLEGATKVAINAMTFVPKANTLVAGSWDDIVLWNWSKGQQISKVQTKEHRVTCFALSPDGGRGLSGSYNKTLRLWDMKTARVLRELPGHTTPIWSVVFSPDGKKALSAGGAPKKEAGEATEYVDCAVRVWDMGRIQELCRFRGHSSLVRHLAFLPDGRRVVSAGLGTTDSIYVWDSTTGKEVRRLAESLKQRVSSATSLHLLLLFGPPGAPRCSAR
jgi:WD40 repeat protein